MPRNATNRDATLPQDGQFYGLTTGRRFYTFVHYAVLCPGAALFFLKSKTPVSYSGFLTRKFATEDTEDTEALDRTGVAAIELVDNLTDNRVGSTVACKSFPLCSPCPLWPIYLVPRLLPANER